MNDDMTKAVDRVRLVKNGREIHEVYGRMGFGSTFNEDLKAIAYAAVDSLDEKDDLK